MKETEESVESAAPTAEEPAAAGAALTGAFGGASRSALARQALAMQAAAGNRATAALAARMVARAPTMPANAAAPRDDPINLAIPDLVKQRDAVVAQRDALAASVSYHEEAGPLTPELTAKNEADKAEIKRLNGEIVQRNKDLDTLDPSSPITAQQRNDIIARYQIVGLPDQTRNGLTGQAYANQQGMGLGKGGTLTKDGYVLTPSGSIETKVETNNKDDVKSTTTERSSTHRIGAAGGWDVTNTKKTSTIEGDKTSSDERTSKHGLTAFGDPGYSYSYDQKKSSADAAAGTSSSSSKKFEAGAGLGGGNLGYTTQTNGGSQQKFDASVKRGNNAATLGGGYTSSSGKFDDDNALTQGTKQNVSGSGGVFTDKDKGTGYGGDLGYTPTFVKKNPQVKDFEGEQKGAGRQYEGAPTIAAGGRVWTNIKKDPDSDKYLLVTTVNLSVSLGLTGSAGKESANKEKASIGLNASGSAGGEVVFRRLLTETQTTQYLADIKNGGTGSFPEHKLLQIGLKDGWKQAKTSWEAMIRSDPALVLSLQQGESLDATREVGGGGGLTGSAGDGDAGVGANLSGTYKHRVKVSQFKDKTDRADEVRVRIEEVDETGVTYGGSASATMVSGAVSHTTGTTGGRSATFRLNTGSSDFAAVLAALNTAMTLDDLDLFQKKYKSLLIGSSDISGESSGTDVAVTAGPEWLKLKGNIGGSAKTSAEVEKDAEGKRTGGTYSGANTTGGGGGALGLNYQQSVTETYEGKVKDLHDEAGDYQVGTAKTGSAETKTNWGKSWDAGKAALKGDKLKLVTDGVGGVMQTDTTTSESLNAGNKEFDDIVSEAHDETSWNSHEVGARRPKWVKAGAAIRAASKWNDSKNRWDYDIHAIQKIMSGAMANETGGAKDAVDNVIRSTKSGQGGVRSEFPGELASLEKDFTDLVVTDPVASLSSLRVADKVLIDNMGKSDQKPVSDAYSKAVSELHGVRDRLEALAKGLSGKEGLFSAPGVHAEMLAAIIKRLHSVNSEITAAETHIAGPTTVAGGYTESIEDGPVDYKAKFQDEQKLKTSEDSAIKEHNKAEVPEKQQALESMVRQMSALESGIPGLLAKSDSLAGDLTGNVNEINKALNNAKGMFGQWRSLLAECDRLVEWYPGVNGGSAAVKRDAMKGLMAKYEASCAKASKTPW